MTGAVPYPLPDSELFARVSRAIDPRCEMYAFAVQTSGEEQARSYYFHSADYLVGRLLRALEAEGIEPGRSALLDFAGGYGRFTRFFAPVFARVTVSDLDPAMLEFCRRELGAGGFLSAGDPDALDPRPEHDVVFVFSLFTHLPESLWSRWLRTLWGFVRPGGALVFSTRSPALGERMDESGGGPETPVAASLRGEPLAVVERRYQPLASRTLQLYGIRLEVRAGARHRVSGVICARLRVDAPGVSIGAPRVAEKRPGEAVELGGPRAAIEPHAQHAIVSLEIPFTARGRVRECPIGALYVPLEFADPTPAGVDLCGGGPTVRVDDVRWEEEPAPGAADAMPPFSFRPTNETHGRLDPERYGSTTVTPAFVEAELAKLPGVGPHRHFPGGEMDLYQDVFLVRKR